MRTRLHLVLPLLVCTVALTSAGYGSKRSNPCAAHFGKKNAVVICAASQLGGEKGAKPSFSFSAKRRKVRTSRGVSTINGTPLRPGEIVTVKGPVPPDAVLLVRIKKRDGQVMTGGYYELPVTRSEAGETGFILKIRGGSCPWAGRKHELSGLEIPDFPFLSVPSCGYKKSGGSKAVRNVLAAAADRTRAMKVAGVWYSASESGNWDAVCPYVGGKMLKEIGGSEAACRSYFLAHPAEDAPCGCRWEIQEINGPTYIKGRLIDKKHFYVDARVETGQKEGDEWGLALEREPGRGLVIVDENG